MVCKLTGPVVQVARPEDELAIDAIAVCAGSGELLVSVDGVGRTAEHSQAEVCSKVFTPIV